MSVAATGAPVKLPLAVKKEIRDLEPKKVAALEKLAAVVGFPVEFTFDLDAAWTAMEGHKDQNSLVRVVIDKYLPAVVVALTRGWDDVLVRAAFLAQFTTKVLTLTIVSNDYKEDKSAGMAVWNGYNGLRLVDGKLDIFFKPSSFWVNTDKLEQIKLSELLANVPGALPLPLLVKIRDTTAERTALLERIAKAVGVDAVTFNIEADVAQVLANIVDKAKIDVGAFNQYLKALAVLLEKKCADEMVKEAVVDSFATKSIRLNVVSDMKKVTGAKIDNMYNGIQFDAGVLTIMIEKDTFWSNVSKLEQLDIVKLF